MCNDPEGKLSFEEKMCCDWEDKTKTKCACNTLVAGPCPDDNEACLCCMMIAEAANETSAACKGAVACVIKARSPNGTDYCKGGASQVGKGGNTASFTPNKCTCDRYGDGDGNYNQTYCDCREKICAAGGDKKAVKGCLKMLDIASNTDCDSLGGIDSYQVGSCPAGCKTVSVGACKHTFCDCY